MEGPFEDVLSEAIVSQQLVETTMQWLKGFVMFGFVLPCCCVRSDVILDAPFYLWTRATPASPKRRVGSSTALNQWISEAFASYFSPCGRVWLERSSAPTYSHNNIRTLTTPHCLFVSQFHDLLILLIFLPRQRYLSLSSVPASTVVALK
jgi:hypothetical protein